MAKNGVNHVLQVFHSFSRRKADIWCLGCVYNTLDARLALSHKIFRSKLANFPSLQKIQKHRLSNNHTV